jgi:hypothetical protein
VPPLAYDVEEWDRGNDDVLCERRRPPSYNSSYSEGEDEVTTEDGDDEDPDFNPSAPNMLEGAEATAAEEEETTTEEGSEMEEDSNPAPPPKRGVLKRSVSFLGNMVRRGRKSAATDEHVGSKSVAGGSKSAAGGLANRGAPRHSLPKRKPTIPRSSNRDDPPPTNKLLQPEPYNSAQEYCFVQVTN